MLWLMVLVAMFILPGCSNTNAEKQFLAKAKTGAQRRNAKLLSGYDYSKYISALSGFSGQDRQRIGFVRFAPAIRSRIGPRGSFKAGLTQLPNGKLIAAVMRKKQFSTPIHIYESSDLGLTWKEISQTLKAFDDDKEPTLTALPDGSLVLITQQRPVSDDYYTPYSGTAIHIIREIAAGLEKKNVPLDTADIAARLTTPVELIHIILNRLVTNGLLVKSSESKTGFIAAGDTSLTEFADAAAALERKRPLAISVDGGRTWETTLLTGSDYPRSLVVEPDGSLLMVRALKKAWFEGGKGNRDFMLSRSKDAGRTWVNSVGKVDWDYARFDEMSCIRLKDGRLLATLRRRIPDAEAHGEGFEDSFITESFDDGKTWAKPWRLTDCGQVHAYLTELNDGRILATYSNYHIPWGVSAIISEDCGRTWDMENRIQLGLSADLDVGWPVTLQLADGSLITSYGTTTHLQADYLHPNYGNWVSEKQTCEVVRWWLPKAK